VSRFCCEACGSANISVGMMRSLSDNLYEYCNACFFSQVAHYSDSLRESVYVFSTVYGCGYSVGNFAVNRFRGKVPRLRASRGRHSYATGRNHLALLPRLRLGVFRQRLEFASIYGR
jgi:hypothetical protein